MDDLKYVFAHLRPYRRQVAAAVGLVFVECIFEMSIPMLMTGLVDVGVANRDVPYMLSQGGKMVLCALLALITGLLYARYAARAAYGFGAELRLAEYRKVQSFAFSNLDRFSTSSLVTRMTTDVTVMQNAITGGLRPLVRSPVMLFMGVGMSFLLNPGLSLVFFVAAPVLGIIMAFLVTRIGPLYVRQQTAVDHLNGRIQESLTAIRAIKAFVRGEHEDEAFDAVNKELTDTSVDTFRHAALNQPAFQVVMYTAVVCIMYYEDDRHNLFKYTLRSFLEENSEALGLENRQKEDIQRLIRDGESNRLEFKSTLRTNLETGETDKRMEKAVLKTIVAFLNTDGGNLLIGVDDDGDIIGADIQSFENKDKMGLHLTNLIASKIGNSFLPFITFNLIDFDDKVVIRVKCDPCPMPVFYKDGKIEIFYVRSGPRTEELTGMTLISYIKNRESDKRMRKLMKRFKDVEPDLSQRCDDSDGA